MPRKKRPPIPPITPEPGWTDYRSGARPEIFSNGFVEALVRKFKIERARIPELKKALEDWADVFRVHKWGADDRPRRSALSAELAEVRSRIDALRSALETMHPDSEWRFWRPESQIEFPLDSNEKVATSTYGHTMFKVQTCLEPPSWALFHINRVRHFESLTILRNYADEAIARLGKDEGGRIRSEGLRMWAVNVINYWEKFLKRPFALKCYRGQPTTDPALFCVEAFKPIDPTVPTARLVTAMRHAMKTRAKRTVATTPSE